MKPEQLKQFRKSRGWSQKRLADELGVIQQAISKWEAGKREIPKYIEKSIGYLEKNERKEK
jgi:transcriptional regulator with XRE-family HTH domain